MALKSMKSQRPSLELAECFKIEMTKITEDLQKKFEIMYREKPQDENEHSDN